VQSELCSGHLKQGLLCGNDPSDHGSQEKREESGYRNQMPSSGGRVPGANQRYCGYCQNEQTLQKGIDYNRQPLAAQERGHHVEFSSLFSDKGERSDAGAALKDSACVAETNGKLSCGGSLCGLKRDIRKLRPLIRPDLQPELPDLGKVAPVVVGHRSRIAELQIDHVHFAI
jgi:hypothetical protein